jgi:hypothetical protein
VPVDWPTTSSGIEALLKGKFPELQAAVAEYEPYVPPWQRWAFKRAWNRYRLGKEGRDIDGQDYWQYIPHSGAGIVDGKRIEHDNTSTYMTAFKNNVERLLRYAGEI